MGIQQGCSSQPRIRDHGNAKKYGIMGHGNGQKHGKARDNGTRDFEKLLFWKLKNLFIKKLQIMMINNIFSTFSGSNRFLRIVFYLLLAR